MKRPLLCSLCVAVACTGEPTEPQPDPDANPVVILHTSDEHGWLEPPSTGTLTYGGPGVVKAMWDEREGYRPESHLVLSSGDSTLAGGATSQWFEGAPGIEVMNALGYDGATLGNHELDLGQAVFAGLMEDSDFPWMAANVDASGTPVAALTDKTLYEREGLSIGVIGLAHPQTASMGFAANMEGLVFSDASLAIDVAAGELRDEGADAVIVLAHACTNVAEEVLPAVTASVDLWLGGHCHAVVDTEVAGVPVIESGDNWTGYTRVVLYQEDGAFTGLATQWQSAGWLTGTEPPYPPDASVQALVDDWLDASADALDEPVGYSATGLNRSSWAMANWHTDAWLAAVPEAELALTFIARADLPPGDFDVGDVVTVLPFENDLVRLEVSGQDLHDYLRDSVDDYPPFVAGFTYTVTDGTVDVQLDSGQPFDLGATYAVVTTDFFAQHPERPFHTWDDTPTVTGLHYRDPVIAWTQAQATSASRPLEDLIDATPRGPR